MTTPKYTVEQLRELRAKIAEIELKHRRLAGPWHCPDCCNVFEDKPRRGRCSECGSKVVGENENPRQKGDDDGVEYGHPGDHLRGLE